MSRHHQRTLIFSLFVLLFSACAGLGSFGLRAGGDPFESDGIQGVIFTAEQIAASEHWPNNDHPWTPSEADILTLEEELTGYLEEAYPQLWQRLDEYTRQYWGTVTPDGNRAIYVNFLCDAERMSSYIDWRSNRVEIMDGGDCYFQTLYDIEEGIFVWLTINGES